MSDDKDCPLCLGPPDDLHYTPDGRLHGRAYAGPFLDALVGARAGDVTAGRLRLSLKGRVLSDGSPAAVDIPATPGEDSAALVARIVAAWGSLLAESKEAPST